MTLVAEGGTLVAEGGTLAGTGPTIAETILEDTPGAYWPLDEGAGTTATDLSGNGRDGTITGGAWATDATSPTGVAWEANGDDRITVPAAAINQNGVYTVETWVRYTTTPDADHVLLSMFTSSTDYWMLVQRADAGGLCLQHRAPIHGETRFVSFGAALRCDGTWQHVAVTRGDGGGTKWKVYIDGQLVGSTDDLGTTGTHAAGTLYVGHSPTTNYLKGRLAHFATFPAALSAARILAHYQAAAMPEPADPATVTPLGAAMLADKPVLLYELQEAGSTATDATQHGLAGSHGASRVAGPGGGVDFAIQQNDTGDVLATPWVRQPTEFTAACLFKYAGQAGRDRYTLFSKSAYFAPTFPDFPVTLHVAHATGVLQALFSTGNDFTADLTLTGPNVNDGQWHLVHLVYVRGGTSKLYVDGTEVASASSVNISASTYAFSFLREAAETSSGVGKSVLNGQLACAAMWGHALTAGQISAQAAAAP